MTVDVDNLANALQTCAALKSCDRCFYKEKCLQHPSVNAAMVDAAAFIRYASRFIKNHLTRRLTPNEMIEHHCNPIYIVTNQPDIDEWFFYVGHVDRKGGLFLFRNSDGQVHDFWESEYGKTWLAFNGEVTDALWEEAKKDMEGSAEK